MIGWIRQRRKNYLSHTGNVCDFDEPYADGVISLTYMPMSQEFGIGYVKQYF